MIATLTGRIVARSSDSCVLEVGGVGFRVAMSTRSLAALPAAGDEITVHTHLHVREDELALFGFESEAEKTAFEALITVTGVGPKVALAALSTLSPSELAAAVSAQDIAAITNIPGVGRKTAQRMILDLSDKLGGVVGDGGVIGVAGAVATAEAAAALLTMGFTSAEADVALGGYHGDPTDTQSLVTHALRRLGANG